jgi:hypothetical protein
MPDAAKVALRTTATAIVQRDRTSDGFYGGDWGGPVDPALSIWGRKGSVPRQITTSSTAVAMVVASGFLDTLASTLPPATSTPNVFQNPTPTVFQNPKPASTPPDNNAFLKWFRQLIKSIENLLARLFR